MKIKVAELEGEKLDYWAGKALGWKQVIWGRGHAVWVQADDECRFRCNVAGWKPSTDWSQGGPILEREKISILPRIDGSWYAEVPMEIKQDGVFAVGATPLIAAMRCYLASRFGDYVQDGQE